MSSTKKSMHTSSGNGQLLDVSKDGATTEPLVAATETVLTPPNAVLSSLSRPQISQLMEGKPLSMLQQEQGNHDSGKVDSYPKPETRILHFTREEITSNWVYQSESGSFCLVPLQSTPWMNDWLISQKIIPPTFAPRFEWETQIVLPGGRKRRSLKTDDLRKLCDGTFQKQADFFKVFVCSWMKSKLHSCPSKLVVSLCTASLSCDDERPIEIQCSWTSGCEHHSNDVERGIVRRHAMQRNVGNVFNTPKSICLKTHEEANPLAVAAGNRTFGHLRTGPARAAKHLTKKMNYKFGTNLIGNISAIASEIANEHQKSDPSGYLPFYGSVHDVVISNTGDLLSVSMYHALSIQVTAIGITGSKNATAIIDCTGGVVGDLWISTASDIVRRAQSRGSKKRTKVSADGSKALVDVLNFHLVLPLPTGPFVALESLIVDKTSNTFEDILTKFRRRLLVHGPDATDIRYFVADMAIPFAIAVVSVFNCMKLPEYVSVLLFASKTGVESIASNNIRTKVVWCDVHGDRALRDKAREFYRKSPDSFIQQMIMLFRNFRMALVASKTYRELCLMTGFLDCITSLQSFKVLPPEEESSLETLVSEQQLFEKGEQILWSTLGGVPSRNDPDHLPTVRVNSCKAKGYNTSSYEEDIIGKSEKPQAHEEVILDQSLQEELQNAAATGATPIEATAGLGTSIEENAVETECLSSTVFEQSFLEHVPDAKLGVHTYVIGPFHVHLVYREKSKETGLCRYRVYVPSLSLLPKSIGGYTAWIDMNGKQKRIRNEVYLDGKVRRYLQNQWFANVAMFCPILIGEPPYTHNTLVEISFKVLKNHTDLGVEARIQRKMELCEYVKKSACQKRAEAAMVVGELATHYRKLKFQNKQNLKGREKREKKRTLSQICKHKSLTEENTKLVAGVFRKKNEKETEEEKDNGVRTDGKDKAEPVPPTLQSQSDVMTIEEAWMKRKRRRPTDEERTQFKESFQSTLNTAFRGWSLRRIAAFLNTNVLNPKGLSIDHSRISKLLSGKAFLSLELRTEIQSFFNDELPNRAVDNETDIVRFSLIPWVPTTLDLLISSPSAQEREPNILSSYGDARVTLNDIKRLIVRETQGQQHWVSDESVNLLTNLFSAMKGTESCFYFSSLLLENVYNIHYGVGAFSELSESEKLSQMEKRAHRQGNTRPGQVSSFDASKKAFWPCLVNKNHWIGFQIDKEMRRITCVDSMRDLSKDSAVRYGAVLEVFLSMVDSGKWSYAGQDLSFPQQKNGIDCGIIMLIAARNWKLEQGVPEECTFQACTEKWRQRFAKEVLAKRSS